MKNNTNHYKRLLEFYNDITVKVVKKKKKNESYGSFFRGCLAGAWNK